MKIILQEIEYEVHLLSAREMLDCIRVAQQTEETLATETNGESSELTCALAEYGALAAFCLHKGESRAFAGTEAALAALTTDELCDIYDCYEQLSQCGERGLSQ